MLSGVFNGKDVLLRVKTDDDWLVIGGQMSHTTTQNNAAIDITDKSANDFRCLLDAKGLQTFDVTGELIFSSDQAFDYCKQAYNNKSIEVFQVVKGTLGTNDDVTEFSAMVTGWSEVAPMSDKTTANITLTNSESVDYDLSFEGFFASTDGQFITSTGQNFFVRI